LGVGLIGLVITGVSTVVASTLNEHNDHRLLEVQTRQAKELLSATIVQLQAPLTDALDVAIATSGDAADFASTLASAVGPRGLFVDASLWERRGAGYAPVAAIGTTRALGPSSLAESFVGRAARSTTFLVQPVVHGTSERIAYAVGRRTDSRFVVLAERAIPSDRRVSIESNPAFSNLDYATYLGAVTAADLATTDVAPHDLPLSGDVVTATIPFGDTSLTFAAQASAPMGGTLSEDLQWIVLVGGMLVTAVATIASEQVVRRRHAAEFDAAKISGLYAQLDELYGEQRTIAETLQRALLPAGLPTIANLEIASRYLPGARGVQVGGDWFNIIAIDDHHVGFAIGDVSGKGVSAAAVMARLRFTVRAYLLEGHAPNVVLELCSSQLDVTNDAHFSTALVAVVDLEEHSVTLASAGHLPPLVISPTEAHYVDTPIGPPLGMRCSTYLSTTLVIAPGSTLLAFTDGLVERRGESIDAGLGRLAHHALNTTGALDYLLTQLVECGSSDHVGGFDDDVAIVAMRWLDYSET